MSIGRSSMGKQIAVTRSSRDGVLKKGDGGLVMLSPAASLVKSLQSGKPEGLMKMLPLGAAMAAAQKGKTGQTERDKAKAATGAATPMKSGGSVRGCGCAVRGKGKGRMV